MNLNVHIEDFHQGLMAPLVTLFGSYFDQADRLLTDEYNTWLYLNNPFGVAKIVTVKECEEWIGFMALIPVELEQCDRTLKSYFVVNVLVHPEHHGRNIFGRMIGVAKAYVADEGASLMGHPNKMAIKSWQRAKMHFHRPLRVCLAVPRVLGRNAISEAVDALDSNSQLWEDLEKQRQLENQWQIQVNDKFLTWRFIDHPTNQYQVHWLKMNGKSIGIQVTKRMKYGIHLLVDSFVLSDFKKIEFGSLPWLTIAMRTRAKKSWLFNGLMALPVNKQLPFFLTDDLLPILVEDAAQLGLAASDF